MEKLLQMLSSLIERIEARQPQVETGEWYLLNNLRRFKQVTEGSPSQHEFENATLVLSRFNVDSMDWDDPLFKETTAITEQARHVQL
jgi:hypothetical protein